MNDLTITTPKQALTTADALDFVPADASRTTRSRLTIFTDWLAANDGDLLKPDMRGYVRHLEKERGLSPSSVAAHINTVRGRYRKHVLNSNAVRDSLTRQAAAAGHTDPASVRAVIDEHLTRLDNALSSVTVTAPKQRVRTDERRGRWLTKLEIRDLLTLPDTSTLIGKRDYALLVLMLATGIRAKEVCDVTVNDLFQSDGRLQTTHGKPGLFVRSGKGAKERFVYYGDNAGRVERAVRAWLDAANITSGFVFRGVTPQAAVKMRANVDKPIEPGDFATSRMNPRTLNYLFKSFDVSGAPVHPHDLRRTYAELLRDSGMRLEYISTLLGHASVETTKRYLNLDSAAIDVPKVW